MCSDLSLTLTNMGFPRHGRDHRLRIWQLEQADIESLDRRLPVEGEQPEPRKEPWLLHSIAVNALNFCAFAMCYDQKALSETSPVSANDVPVPVARGKRVDEIADISFQSGRPQRDILIAVANALDSGAIDFFHLPSERRVSTLPADNDAKTGMVMAISLYRPTADGLLMVVSGYESGHVMVHIQQSSHISDLRCLWKKALVSQPHSQPLLSLDVSPTGGFFLTSSADAIIAKYEVPRDASRLVFAQKPTKILNTKHAGQQGLSIRSDGKVFATAGWDARIRVYSAKAMAELAVLKWHQEGCYAVSFAKTDPDLAPKRTAVEAANREAVPSQHTSALDAIKEQRNARAQNTHWLAAGGKDGKISLWDIY